MPYEDVQDLPEEVKQLPEHGQKIFLAAFNSAYDGTCKDKGDKRESCAFSIAWVAVKQKYQKVGDVWKATEETKSIHSVLKDKPKIDNGVWIPFLKDDQLAEDNEGRQYRLTKSAIDSGYKSYIGGFININHQDKIQGKIADVKRDGEFVYAKIEGLNEEALEVINSPAYRGVSQQSINLQAEPGQGGLIDVLGIKGTGIAIALYPKTPGCPLHMGCGIPVDGEANISLNTHSSNSQIKSTGGTNTNMTELEVSAEALKSITSERDALMAKVDALTSELDKLKSTLSDPNKRIAELEKTIGEMKVNNAQTLKSALEEHKKKTDAEADYKKEYDSVVSELRSVMLRELLEKKLASKTSLEVLKSDLELLKAMGATPRAGAVHGEITSTDEQRIRKEMQDLSIPRIEFV